MCDFMDYIGSTIFGIFSLKCVQCHNQGEYSHNACWNLKCEFLGRRFEQRRGAYCNFYPASIDACAGAGAVRAAVGLECVILWITSDL